ncbi:TonB-dependent receptor plug domain-containing protein [Undibacterium sp. RuRC25W]|uniref:TonB-dependent receptor plug domain-containing protein n=1 Tax=Undibacterium sp. RuRC25W TaxID=3413047 RepID=UPI003BF43724
MKKLFKWCCLSSSAQVAQLCIFSTVAYANTDQLQTVEMTTVNANDKIRQAEPTIVSLYGHEELARYGDTSLSDTLKRLPGITVSENKNKETVISLRGLGTGYTQILLNGEPMPDGFAIDSIAPDAIDHIEIMRVAGADKSAQGIAGSINIVLRKKTSQSPPEIKWRLNENNHQWSPGMSLSSSGNAGKVGYNLNAVVDRSNSDNIDQISEALLQKGPLGSNAAPTVVASRQLTHVTQLQRETLSLTPHVHWQIQSNDTLGWQGFLNQLYVHQQKQETQSESVGASTDFPNNVGVWNAHITTARNTLTWDRRLEDDAKLSVTGGWNFFRRVSFFHFLGNDANNQLLQTRDVSVQAIEDEFRLNGKYALSPSENHSVSLGWESSRGQRHESRQELNLDPQGNPMLNTDQPYAVSISKFALFAQDEWRLSSQWLAYVGVRWEDVKVQSMQPSALAMRHSDRLFAPILQTILQLDNQRQWRFAFNRTIKAPVLMTLIPRVIRIDNDNGPLNPDQQGNPALHAEKSWGFDIAYEQFHINGNTLSASMYVRKIQDVIQDVLLQQPNGWLTMPVNNGSADVAGVEFETKLSLVTLNAALPKINVHANVNRNWSRVKNVLGPDNRIADQVKLSANLSLDYQLRPGWTAGGTYSLQSKGTERASAYLVSTQSTSHRLDLYSLWQVTSQGQLRLSVSHLRPQTELGFSAYEDAQIRATQQTSQPANAVWHLLWEQRF